MFKRLPKFIPMPSTKVYETLPQSTSQFVGADSVDVVVFVPIDLTSKDAEDSLPASKEMKLDNLLTAGVKLNQLNPQTLFNPTDVASVSDTVSAIVSNFPNSK